MSGKIIEIAGEEITIKGGAVSLHANDGNFVANAGGNNNWNTKKGIVLSEFKATEIDSRKKINLEIGVFFDGTSNNKYNTKIGASSKSSELKGSYGKDDTNVARLFDLYPDKIEDFNKTQTVQFPIYVEGVGTLKGKTDNIISVSTGGEWGNGRGIKGKVDVAIRDIANRIVELNIKNINSISFDVFGFSRGAASARHFCNIMKEIVIEKQFSNFGYYSYDRKNISNEGGTLYKELKGKVGEMPKLFNIRYLGLFDTVTAVFNPDKGDGSVSNASNPTIKLDVSKLNAQQVVHLTAQDEHRKYFSLNKISKGYRFSMCGSHSDVGGGYHTGIETVVLDYGTKKSDKERLEKERLRWIKEGWYLEGELKVENKSVTTTRKGRQGTLITSTRHSYFLKGTKKVSNNYTYIPLHIMHLLAKKSNVPFKDVSSSHAVVAELKGIFKIYKTIALTNKKLTLSVADFKLLRHKYIHQSANYNETFGIYINKPVEERSEFDTLKLKK